MRIDVLQKSEGSTSHWYCSGYADRKWEIRYFDNNLDTSHILRIHLWDICILCPIRNSHFCAFWIIIRPFLPFPSCLGHFLSKIFIYIYFWPWPSFCCICHISQLRKEEHENHSRNKSRFCSKHSVCSSMKQEEDD